MTKMVIRRAKEEHVDRSKYNARPVKWGRWAPRILAAPLQMHRIERCTYSIGGDRATDTFAASAMALGLGRGKRGSSLQRRHPSLRGVAQFKRGSHEILLHSSGPTTRIWFGDNPTTPRRKTIDYAHALTATIPTETTSNVRNSMGFCMWVSASKADTTTVHRRRRVLVTGHALWSKV